MTWTAAGVGLGSYRNVLLAILRVIGIEPIAWTAAGMLQGSSAPRRLLACAALNSLATASVFKRLKRNPELLMDTDWIDRQSVLVLLRYLVYPAITTRRTYWRRPSNDAAFFIQTWAPIAWQGAGRDSGAAIIAGSVYSPLAYLAAAIVNGETMSAPPEVKRRVLAHSLGTVIAGIFTASMATTLSSARTDALEAERLADEVARALAERAQAQDAFDTWKQSLADIQVAVARQLPPEDALQILRELDAELKSDMGSSVTPRGTVDDVIMTAAEDHGIDVEVVVSGPIECDLPSLQAVNLVVQSALGNVQKHSGTTSARISYMVRNGEITLTVDDLGSGIAIEVDEFDPHHALGHTQAYLRGLGGRLTVGPGVAKGTTVTANWRTE